MPLIKTGPLDKKLIEQFLILESDFLNQPVSVISAGGSGSFACV